MGFVIGPGSTLNADGTYTAVWFTNPQALIDTMVFLPAVEGVPYVCLWKIPI